MTACSAFLQQLKSGIKNMRSTHLILFMNNFYAFPLFCANRHELHSGRDPIVPECFGGVLRRTQREEQVSPFFRKGYFFVRSNSFSSNWLFSTHIQKKLASACFKKNRFFFAGKEKKDVLFLTQRDF